MSETSIVASAEKITTYDDVPYESLPFEQAHPDRMATMAKLFGMNPAPMETCRVLELGSAAGGHIIPFAYSYPGSHVVGIDLSQVQIDEGNALVSALGLKNIELKQMSISDVKPDLGTFDYIICHGVFAWIPDKVQEDVLRICEQMLSPNGVAYISYNCYPGWRMRGMIREMMQYHSAQFSDVQTKVFQARALLSFLGESVPADTAYGMMLKSEVDFLNPQPDSYMYHEFLEDLNKPMYFHDFAERAQRHKLQYLGESEIFSMLTNNLPQQVADTITSISNEIVRTEQYLDFVRNKYFRQTLLCRQEMVLNRALGPHSVLPFYIAGAIQPVSQEMDIRSNQPDYFEIPPGIRMGTSNPLTKAALQHLGKIWPQCIEVEELIRIAQTSIAAGGISVKDSATIELEKNSLASDILTMYANGLCRLRTGKAAFTTALSEKPKASELARQQAVKGMHITNQLHQVVSADQLGNKVIELCDGQKTRSEILQALAAFFKEGKLNLQKDGKTVTDESTLKEILEPMLDNCLERLRMAALLIA
ncbi:MAG: class I SAM-dependent methyltransferase [Candidatus Obscuribacterales bacterium]|jgi:methyltransferase-like protein/2-polyprenyl-3-methyl-5-hydroxy-6-metoxy-1,4-benzoquinol methylase|nr:class I SAM-dependent methyltransferase [Candidatus Obscuribacterales bacterium]